MRKIRILFLLFVFAVPTLFLFTYDARSYEWYTRNEDLVIHANDLENLEGSGLAAGDDGLILTERNQTGIYISAPIQAPFPFNAVVPQWSADLPPGSSLNLLLRSGTGESNWSDWREIHPSADMTLPDDAKISGNMDFVSGSEETHTHIQIKISLARDDEKINPKLRELRLTFIDSTEGPTTEQLIEMQNTLVQKESENQIEASTSEEGYAKPFVLSRAVWCTSPDCNYSEGLEYHPVSHLILHHTVGIPDGDSAAQMRAYWSYHTYTKGWGDIGYNFVIDLDGYIFEGHLGGNDVIGTHAAGANAGSMGLAMIGSYSVIEPSPPVKESIIDMIAWKADQRDIDVFDTSSALPNVDWGLPHVMGHRDVYGTTECPGDDAHSLLPEIKDEVARRIGLESPHIYVNELSSDFVKSNANWYTAARQCGYNTHAWYTWSTTNPAYAVNWGEWRPEVPHNGRYQIEVHIPYCSTSRSETGAAHYTIEHARGTTNVEIDHQDNVGLWASLGEFDLKAGGSSVIHLTDLSTTDSGLGVWFDDLRLLPLEVLPAAVTEAPANNAWINKRQVQFKWHIENPEELSQTTFQVAADQQFQNIVNTKQWSDAVESYTFTFDRDYGALYWRVILKSKSGTSNPSPYARFGIDTEPPVSSVRSIVWLESSEQYYVTWGGSDTLNYIAHYKIEYHPQNGSWKTWLNGTSGTSAHFSPPTPGQVYEFRSQATDSLSNVEAAHTTADASTEQAKSFSHAIILPVIN